MKIIKQCRDTTLALSKDNILYRCGDHPFWHADYTKLEEYENRDISGQIIDIKVGYKNYGVLTSKEKFYFHGESSSNQLNCNQESWGSLKYLLRPNQRNEKIQHFDIGYEYIIYTTQEGK